MPYINKLLCMFFMFFVFAACSKGAEMPSFFSSDSESEKEESIPDDPSAETLYNNGMDYLQEKRYQKAAETFLEIERLYPYSKWSTKGQVMTAYSYYKDEEYDDSVIVIDQFIKLNPGYKDIAYVYYLRAVSYYDRISDVRRDQKITEEALNALSELVRRFPDAKYTRDAKLKIDLVYDHLAGKQMEIGRFYLKRKNFIGAINRFQKVVNEFDTTTHVAEALYRLAESYMSLGLVDEAKKNAAVLGHNYPGSTWYKYAYRLVAQGKNAPLPLDDQPWYKKWISSQEIVKKDLKEGGSKTLIDSIVGVFR